MTATPSSTFLVLSGAVYGLCSDRNAWSLVKGSGAGSLAAVLSRKVPGGVLVVGLPLLRHALQGTTSSFSTEAAKVAGGVAVYAATAALVQGVVVPAVVFGAGSYAVDSAVDALQEVVKSGWPKLRAKL
jgi:hypothetical protein